MTNYINMYSQGGIKITDERGWAKTAEEKDLELTSSHKHTKITTICRTTIAEKDQNLSEKIFYS